MLTDSGKMDVNRTIGDISEAFSAGAFPLDEAENLLRYILKNGSMADFQRLFDCIRSAYATSKYRKGVYFFLDPTFNLFSRLNRDHYTAMLEDGRLSRFEIPLLVWFYYDLRRRCECGDQTSIGQILADRRITEDKRALLCHAVFYAVSGHESERTPFWMYGQSVSKNLKEYRDHDEYDAVRRISVSPRIKFHVPFKVLGMIVNDKCSLFELNRQFEGRRICDSMLECFIHCTAVQCFTYHLSHYQKQVFRLRSPEEWLFTVCRCAKEKLAVAAVNEIERQFPGIVASARDPRGNTLLWNTFVNENPTEELREELIRLGCDPNAKNKWDLSYQLLKDNDPNELLKHEEACHAV